VYTARFDVERIRVSVERSAYAALESEERGAIDRYVPEDATTRRRALLANALLLTETMAPDPYAAAREAMAALGVEDRIELFQSSGDGADAARLVLHGDPIGVEFIGGYLDRLDHGGLLAVLGHEIGHCLAHGGRRLTAWALPTSGRATSPARRACWMAAELTADRFGLLACRDLDAVLRLEMQMVAGRSVRSIRFDTAAYLEQCRALAEQTIADGGMAMGFSHPEHYIRGYAEWLFTETDVYRSITGLGPGSRSIDDVDAILEKLVGTARRAPTASVIANPSPRAEATVAERDDDSRALPDESRTSLASVVLPDAARRKLAAARDTLASFAGASVPSIRRFSAGARDQRGAEGSRSVDDETADPLEDERRELIARFEELERRSKNE
jgi:hypothetical protein